MPKVLKDNEKINCFKQPNQRTYTPVKSVGQRGVYIENIFAQTVQHLPEVDFIVKPYKTGVQKLG